MSFDTHKNFAYSTVATAPSPASSGTSLVVATGDGSKFATNMNCFVCPVGQIPVASNAEIVRITAISTDTLTITRATESSSARSIVVGDAIFNGVTAKVITDIEAKFPLAIVDGGTGATAAGATLQANPANAAWGSMYGMNQTITPAKSGTLLACLSVNQDRQTSWRLKYGTGTPPTNGAAETGATLSATQTAGQSSSTTTYPGAPAPSPIFAIVTGLSIGTAYWFDMFANNGGAFTGSNSVQLTVVEL